MQSPVRELRRRPASPVSGMARADIVTRSKLARRDPLEELTDRLGNQAIERLLRGDRPPRSSTGGRPGADGRTVGSSPAEPRVDLDIGGKLLRGISVRQAADKLRERCTYMEWQIRRERAHHLHLRKLAADQWFVSWVSRVAGGVELPALEIWRGPQHMLERARSKLRETAFGPPRLRVRGISDAVTDLKAAEGLYNRAVGAVEVYQHGSVRGASQATTGLRVVAAGGAVAAAVASGGTAAGVMGPGATLLGTTAWTAAGAGAYGVTQQTAENVSGLAHGTRKDLGLGQILRRGAVDAAVTFAGGAAGGGLARLLASRAKVVPPQFMTLGQQLFFDTLGGLGAAPLALWLSDQADRILGGKGTIPPGMFLSALKGEALRGSVFQVFLSLVLSRSGKNPGPVVRRVGRLLEQLKSARGRIPGQVPVAAIPDELKQKLGHVERARQVMRDADRTKATQERPSSSAPPEPAPGSGHNRELLEQAIQLLLRQRSPFSEYFGGIVASPGLEIGMAPGRPSYLGTFQKPSGPGWTPELGYRGKIELFWESNPTLKGLVESLAHELGHAGGIGGSVFAEAVVEANAKAHLWGDKLTIGEIRQVFNWAKAAYDLRSTGLTLEGSMLGHRPQPAPLRPPPDRIR